MNYFKDMTALEIFVFKLFYSSLDCSGDPLPAVMGGSQIWDSTYGFGTEVKYVCADGMTMSYAYCSGELWTYPSTSVVCYDGIPPTPQCSVLITDPSGVISSSDPQYHGCKVTIAIPDSKIMLTATQFMVK